MRLNEPGATDRYLGAVVKALRTAGYRVTGQTTEGVGVWDVPDYIIRVDLNGARGDLIYNTLCWRMISYSYSGNGVMAATTRPITDDIADIPTAVARLVRLAGVLLDEARREWGQPDPVRTWTFYGHWENGRITIDGAVHGEVADDRTDDGRWPEGLWATQAEGSTVEQAEAAAITEYEFEQHDPDDVAVIVAHAAAAGLPGFTPVSPQEGDWAWAKGFLTGLDPAAKLRADDASSALVVALAQAMTDHGPTPTRDQLVGGVADELIDDLHGAGAAELVGALWSWWWDLDDEERSMTGVNAPQAGRHALPLPTRW
jgi:hypothetical protein